MKSGAKYKPTETVIALGLELFKNNVHLYNSRKKKRSKTSDFGARSFGRELIKDGANENWRRFRKAILIPGRSKTKFEFLG